MVRRTNSEQLRIDILVLLIGLLGIMLIVVGTIAPGQTPPDQRFPLVCEEDEVIVGNGDYVSGIGWDNYQCVARDDL